MASKPPTFCAAKFSGEMLYRHLEPSDQTRWCRGKKFEAAPGGQPLIVIQAYVDGGPLFYNFDHFERNPDDGFVILTRFQHIFVILLVIPVDDHFLFPFMDGFQLLKYIEDAL